MIHKSACFPSLFHGGRGVSKNEVWWPQQAMLWILVVQVKTFKS